jgi:hypothetical protein
VVFSKEDFRLMRGLIIRQYYYHIEFNENQTFTQICERLSNSGEFSLYPQGSDKHLFSVRRRSEGETIKAFEIKGGIKVINLNLMDTRINGHLRVLLSIYRSKFVVFSIVHGIVTKATEEEKLNCLGGDDPLSLEDVLFIQEDQIGRLSRLEYEIEWGGREAKLDMSSIQDLLIKMLEGFGLSIQKKTMDGRRVVHCWDFLPAYKRFEDYLEDNYRELHVLFTTPMDIPSRERAFKMKKHTIEDLRSELHLDMRDRFLLIRELSMLIMSSRGALGRAMSSQLIAVYQLMSLQRFVLYFYSLEARRLASAISRAAQHEYFRLSEEITKVREEFNLALEDLYWVETDLFRLQSANLIGQYKAKYGLDKTLDIVQKRLDWTKNSCLEKLADLERAASAKRERSITTLTIIFASFGIGDIVAAFMIWYFGLILGQMSPVLFLAVGILITFVVVFSVFLVAVWYIDRGHEKHARAILFL